MRKQILFLFMACLLVNALAMAYQAGAVPATSPLWHHELVLALKNGGAYVETEAEKPLFAHRENEHFIPASILKLATAAYALKELGPDFRFQTDFFITKDEKLFVKGYGDPLLTSEELEQIAVTLHEKGIREIKGLYLDDGYFDKSIVIDGGAHSDNPYDATNNALYANFNTIAVRKYKNGTLAPGEVHTPLTPLAYKKAARLKAGSHRINLGGTKSEATLYVGELLQAFLKQKGVLVSGPLALETVPDTANLFYEHKSSKNLEEILKGLLKYSTNITTNQIFLVLGAKKCGAPATMEKGVMALSEFLGKELGWKDFFIVEASGLSRRNEVTPYEMIVLLRYLDPYKDLFPKKEDGLFLAKTGTLNGVSTLAGYMPLEQGGHARFVLIVNDAVSYAYKFKVGRLLYAALNPSQRQIVLKQK